MSKDNDLVVYYTVPKSKEAMDTWLPGITDFDKYEHYEVNEKSNDAIWKLYNSLNKRFNIIIDNCEDETLPSSCLEEALDMVGKYMNTADGIEHKYVLEKLTLAIKAAIKYGTCLFFDF